MIGRTTSPRRDKFDKADLTYVRSFKWAAPRPNFTCELTTATFLWLFLETAHTSGINGVCVLERSREWQKKNVQVLLHIIMT